MGKYWFAILVFPHEVVSRRLKYETTKSTFSYAPEVYLQHGNILYLPGPAHPSSHTVYGTVRNKIHYCPPLFHTNRQQLTISTTFWPGLSMRSVTAVKQQVPPSCFTTREFILLKIRWKYISIQCSPIFDTALLFERFPGYLPFVLLVRATWWRWVWSMGGMTLTGQNRFKD
jgi:hypothetical protein